MDRPVGNLGTAERLEDRQWYRRVSIDITDLPEVAMITAEAIEHHAKKRGLRFGMFHAGVVYSGCESTFPVYVVPTATCKHTHVPALDIELLRRPDASVTRRTYTTRHVR